MTQNFRPLIVVCAYNPGNSIVPVVESLMSHDVPILVVDDGSTDIHQTYVTSCPSTYHIRLDRNKGKGYALRQAMAFAANNGFSHIINCDGDGQHKSEDVGKLLQASRQWPQSLILGVRDFSPHNPNIPRASRFGRHFSNFWVAVETGSYLKDTQSGLRSYPVATWGQVPVTCTRYDFEVEILTRGLWQGLPFQEIDVGVIYPPPHERTSHFDPIKDNARLTYLHTKLCCQMILKFFLGSSRPRSQAAPSLAMKKTSDSRVGQTVIFRTLPWVGPYSAYIIATFISFLHFVYRKKERRAIQDFYSRLNPGRPLTNWCRAAINFALFGYILIDRAFCLRNPSALPWASTPPLPFNRGQMWLGAHVGDWLLGALRLAQRDIAQSDHRPIALLVNETVSPHFLARVRTFAPHSLEIIDTSQGLSLDVLRIKAIIEQGGIVACLADRPPPNGYGSPLPFLDHVTKFDPNPFRLAAALRCPVVAFVATKSGVGPRRYRLHYDVLASGQEGFSSNHLMMKFVSFLEQEVRRCPSQWFNFFSFWKIPAW